MVEAMAVASRSWLAASLLLVLLGLCANAQDECSQCRLADVSGSPTCTQVFAYPNSCPYSFAVNSSTASLRGTCRNVSTTDCTDSTGSFTCSNCTPSATMNATRCCVRPAVAAQQVCTVSATNPIRMCCRQYQTKCNSCAPNRFGTPFSISNTSLPSRAQCSRRILGCPVNLVPVSAPGEDGDTCYFCIDPNCRQTPWSDCTTCLSCINGFGFTADGSCQALPQLNYNFVSAENLFQYGVCTSVIDLSTDYDKNFTSMRLVVWGAGTAGSRMPYTSTVASLGVRFALLNGTLIHNGTDPIRPVPLGSPSGFAVFNASLGVNIAFSFINITNGLNVSCTSTLRVTDRQPPNITCTDFVLPTDPGRPWANFSWPRSVPASDNVGVGNVSCSGGPANNIFNISLGPHPWPNMSLIQAPRPFTLGCIAFDLQRNNRTCNYTVTIIDIEAPRLSCPAVATAPNTFRQNVGRLANTSIVFASDNVNVSRVVCAPFLNSTFPLGSTNVSCTAFDTSGNSASCLIRVDIIDNEPPVLTCRNQTVNATSTAPSAPYTVSVPAADNSGLPVNVTCSPGGFPSSLVFPLNNTVVNCTGTDYVFNHAWCLLTVTVVDTTAPVLTCRDIEAESVIGMDYGRIPNGYVVSTFDNVHVQSVICSPIDSPLVNFSMGPNLATCAATDDAGNVGSCAFIVTGVDVEAPHVTCPMSITTGTFNETDINISFSAPQAWDNVMLLNTTIEVLFNNSMRFVLPGNATMFSLPARGTATMTFTATDTSRLSSVCFWSITAYKQSLPPDLIKPNISGCPSPTLFYTPPSSDFSAYDSLGSQVHTINVTTRPGRDFALVNWTTLNASDDSGFVIAAYLDWSPSQAQARSGLRVGKYVVVFGATDAQGNAAYCVFRVVVRDVEAPRFANCPNNMQYQTGSSPDVEATDWPVLGIYAIDNADISDMYGTCTSIPDGLCPVGGARPTRRFVPGRYQFVYSAQDDAGNAAAPCRFNITVIDNFAPVIQGCESNSILAYTSSGRATADITTACLNLTATDNVEIASTTYTSSPSGYSCQTPLPITRASRITITFVATDTSGLSSSCPMYFTIQDNEPPTLHNCSSASTTSVSAVCDPGVNYATVTLPMVSATDNSGNATLVNDAPSIIASRVFPLDLTHITFTATDPSGNPSRCVISVLVRDTQPPIILNFPGSGNAYTALIAVDSNSARGSLVLPNLSARDNDMVFSTFYDPEFGVDVNGSSIAYGTPNVSFSFPIGLTNIRFTAIDRSQRLSFVVYTVRVVDNQPPYFTYCPTAPSAAQPAVLEYNTSAGRGFTVVSSWPQPIQPRDYVDGPITPAITSSPVGFSEGSPFRVGDTTLTYMATDAAGNTATCEFIVRVRDFEAPSLICPETVTAVTSGVQDRFALATWRIPFATDNNIVSSFYFDPSTSNITLGSNVSIGSYNITYFAQDPSGNTNSCTFLFQVVLPVIDSPAASSSAQAMATFAGAGGGGALILVVLVAIFLVARTKRLAKKKVDAAASGYAELLAMSDEFILERARVIQDSLIEQRKAEAPMAVMNQVIHAKRKFAPPPVGVEALERYLRDTVGKELWRDDLEIGKQLGAGEFGAVHEGFYCPADAAKLKVAIKMLHKVTGDESKERFLKEAAIMAQFEHPNIVSLVGVCTLPMSEPTLIVLEYMHLGALHGYLQSSMVKDQLETLTMLRMALDVAAGMQYLAETNFVHRDLAARNVLLDKTMTCRIGDFGLSVDLASTEEEEEGFYSGTEGAKIPIRWTAIEAVCFRQFSLASDVWSYGVLLWEIWMYGELPYKGWANRKVTEQVSQGYRLPKPSSCPDSVYEIMIKCWNRNPKRRINFPKINAALVEAWKEAENGDDQSDQGHDNDLYDNSGNAPALAFDDSDDENGSMLRSSGKGGKGAALYDSGADELSPAQKRGTQVTLYDSGEGELIASPGKRGSAAKAGGGDDAEGAAKGAGSQLYDMGTDAFSTAKHHEVAARMAAKSAPPRSRARHALTAGDIGKEVVLQNAARGVLKFVGLNKETNQPCCGVALHKPVEGGHNGTVQKHRYFKCAAGCGVLLDPREVLVPGQAPALITNSIYDAEAVSHTFASGPDGDDDGAEIGSVDSAAKGLAESYHEVGGDGGYLAMEAEEEAASDSEAGVTGGDSGGAGVGTPHSARQVIVESVLNDDGVVVVSRGLKSP